MPGPRPGTTGNSLAGKGNRQRRDRAERLLDLVTLLLNATRPVSREEIFAAFPDDYQDGGAAAERMFERDKADLLAAGVPLEYQRGDEFDSEGYFVDRQRYAMPELDLAPEELAMLFMTGAAALDAGSFPLSRDLIMALNKITLAAGRDMAGAAMLGRQHGVDTAGTAALRLQERLKLLHEAIAARKKVMMAYYSFWRGEQTRRWVDPYGLCCVHGSWFLVGRCHLRDAIRVFHLDRITGLEKNPLNPQQADFQVPEGFRVRDHVARHPWQIRAHEPLTVRLRFLPPVAEVAAKELGPLVERVEEDGPARVLQLQVTYLEGILPTVLWYRQRVEVLEPEQLRQMTQAAWSRLAGRGGD